MTRKTKLRKNEPFWWWCGPLPLKLAFVMTPEAWALAMKHMGLSPDVEPYPDSDGRYTTFDSTKLPELVAVITINVREGVDDSQIAGLIAHEAQHMVQSLTRHMFPYDDKARLDNETEAYLIQWATQNIFNAYLEHGKNG